MSLTDKQKQEREASLGSSDAPVVCGVSSYSSPLELHYKLIGKLPRYEKAEKLHQKIGSKIEPVIAEIAAEELNIKIRRIPVRRHPVHPFMVAHADYEITSNPKGPGLLEVKNRSGQRPWDTLPDDVTLQVAHQLAVTNREWAMVAALFQFGQLETYEVKRDKELEEFLIEIEQRFIVGVRTGVAPTQAWTPENIGILRKLYPTDSGKTIVLEERFAIIAESFELAKKDLKKAEEWKAACEGDLKSAMADATYATAPGYQLSWKSTKASTRFDEERFKQEQPELYAQYLKTIPGYRRFTVKPTKELST